ncbi:hypothetical protein [Natronoflexus pectinivorans]|uniref:Uncharacterized protein n=1 Tax=Natronoflexus pectinivorans TaxID=682526 RepID=A0A4R2GAU2_9BACT|nr:hypothetical protein [Natronoflexus pectinivorans]TCO04429.1 hypothetical protein EV194_11818 [Natronoflexus pectinivorans]
MKKKLFFAIAAGIFAVATITSLDVAIENRESDDLAYDVSVMMEAYASLRQRVDEEPDMESGGGGSFCYWKVIQTAYDYSWIRISCRESLYPDSSKVKCPCGTSDQII